MKHLFEDYWIDEEGNFVINHKRGLSFVLRSKDYKYEYTISRLFKETYAVKLVDIYPKQKSHPFWKFIKK